MRKLAREAAKKIANLCWQSTTSCKQTDYHNQVVPLADHLRFYSEKIRFFGDHQSIICQSFHQGTCQSTVFGAVTKLSSKL